MKKKITILMTVYNGGAYLKSSVKSVLNQSFKDFQFLIVNDCSTDDSLKVIQSFQDARIIVHTNAQNLGQTKSLNVGLKLASGKYIARIDADDYAFPTWIEQLYTFMENNSECAVVSADAVIIDENNRIKKILKSSSSYPDVVLKSITASPINHGGCLMHKDIILQYKGYNEEFGIAADYDLWSRMICDGQRFKSINVPLTAIRIHSHSLSITEKGKTDLIELSRIIYYNVKHLTSKEITKDEASLLWHLFYNSAELTKVEFISALALIREIYFQLRKTVQVSSKHVEQVWQQQNVVLFVKRVFSLIEVHDYLGVRETALIYIKKEGLFNLFSLFYICSFGQKFLLIPWLFCFDILSKIKAHQQINFKDPFR